MYLKIQQKKADPFRESRERECTVWLNPDIDFLLCHILKLDN